MTCLYFFHLLFLIYTIHPRILMIHIFSLLFQPLDIVSPSSKFTLYIGLISKKQALTQKTRNSLHRYGVLAASYKAEPRVYRNARSLRSMKQQKPMSLQINLQSIGFFVSLRFVRKSMHQLCVKSTPLTSQTPENKGVSQECTASAQRDGHASQLPSGLSDALHSFL